MELGLGGRRDCERVRGLELPPAVAGRLRKAGTLGERPGEPEPEPPPALFRNTGDAGNDLISGLRCIRSCSLRAIAVPAQAAFFRVLCGDMFRWALFGLLAEEGRFTGEWPS